MLKRINGDIAELTQYIHDSSSLGDRIQFNFIAIKTTAATTYKHSFWKPFWFS